MAVIPINELVSGNKSNVKSGAKNVVPIDDLISKPQESGFRKILKFTTTPLSESLGGKSLQDLAISTVKQDRPEFQSPIAPFNQNLGLVKPRIATETFIAGSLGSAADIAQTPASYIPIPGLKQIGKIPVGSTNVGRIASNVAVGKGFKQGVSELQSMESALQKIGKTSSRGIQLGTEYNPVVNQSILQAHNYINTPPSSKFKKPSQITTRDTKLVEGYKTINDVIGDIKPKTIEEGLQASQQVKKDLYNTYTTQAKNASKEGATVDLASIANHELKPLLKNEQIITHRKNLLKPIQDYIDDFSRRGKISIDDAQKDLETLNVDIKKSIQSGTVDEQNLGAIKEKLSQAIRNQADENIFNILNKGGYQDLRNKYSAVATVSDELLKAYAKQKKPISGISHPVLDVMSGVDLSQALFNAATGNPAGVIRNLYEAGTKQVVKKGMDVLKNSDKKIELIFKELEKFKIKSKESSFLKMSFKERPKYKSIKKVK